MAAKLNTVEVAPPQSFAMNKIMHKDDKKLLAELQLFSDYEFENVNIDSQLRKYPAHLVRDELVRRLKKRNDLSSDEKKIVFKKIIKIFQRISSNTSFDFSSIDLSLFNERKLSTDEMYRLDLKMQFEKQRDFELSELYKLKRENTEPHIKTHYSKTKDSTECFKCNGLGIINGKACLKCLGRGFLTN